MASATHVCGARAQGGDAEKHRAALLAANPLYQVSEIQNPKPETRNLKPETRNPKPEKGRWNTGVPRSCENATPLGLPHGPTVGS